MRLSENKGVMMHVFIQFLAEQGMLVPYLVALELSVVRRMASTGVTEAEAEVYLCHRMMEGMVASHVRRVSWSSSYISDLTWHNLDREWSALCTHVVDMP